MCRAVRQLGVRREKGEMLRSLDEIPVMMQVEVPARVTGLSACVVLTSCNLQALV